MKEPSWTLKIIDRGPFNHPHGIDPSKHKWINSEGKLKAYCECGAKIELIYNSGK